MNDINNKINSLFIDNFTCFNKLDLQFSSGINVLIGKNGTGKTHILKLIYTFLRATDKLKYRSQNKIFSKETEFEFAVESSLFEIFKVDEMRDLNGTYSDKFELKFNFGKSNTEVNFNAHFDDENISNNNFKSEIPTIPSIYLPPQEILSISSDLKFFCETYQNSYDITYFDLAKALEVPKLKNIGIYESIIKDLLEEIGGNIVKQDNFFYIDYNQKKIKASLLAEGIKKIATVQYLIENGTIKSNSVLLWDEPEVHLNPKMIPILVKLIQKLANSGIQIFIASHDHLLTQQLSMLSEYNTIINAENKDTVPDMKFFVLHEDDNNEIVCEQGKDLTDISYNPIIEEFVNLHDTEQFYFNKSFNTK